MRSAMFFTFVAIGVAVVGELATASGFNEQLKGFEGEGYKLVVPVRSDPLKAGEAASITVPLQEKHEYNLLFECTGACSRLSVGVVDPAGVELLPVFHDKPLTFAFVEVVATGLHTVAVVAAPCPEGTCRVQFAAVGRGVDAPPATLPTGTRPNTPAPSATPPAPGPAPGQSIDRAAAEELIARIFGNAETPIMGTNEAQAARDRAALQQPDRVPQPARTPSEAPGKAPSVIFGQSSVRPANSPQPAAAEVPRRSTVDCDAEYERTRRRIWALSPGPDGANEAQRLQDRLSARCPGY